MKTAHVIMLTAFAAAIAATSPMLAREQGDARVQKQATAPLPNGGALDTLPHGTYQCALPGDAAGEAFEIVPAEQFRIGAASKYRSPEGTGAYLLRGDELIFTRGPKKGERFKRLSTNQLRKMDGETITKLLCTRLTSSD